MHERFSRSQREVTNTLFYHISRKEVITWHEMKQFQQPRHYIFFGNDPFIKLAKRAKKWKMILSSSVAMYSVMHDTHDAKRVPMEQR